MSRGQRIGLIALAVAIAAVAFVIARPENEEDKSSPAADTAPDGSAGEPTATTDTRPEERIRLRAHKPQGGVRRIEVEKGEFVRIAVESDAPDEIHLHGYDIERKVRPSEPARFALRAGIEGVFDIESHEAEGEGGDPVVARLVVQPS